MNYREIPSLEECVLVSRKIAQVTIYRRSEEWRRVVINSREGTLELRSVGLVLAVARIYEGIT